MMKIKNEIFNKKLLCAAGVACALAVNGAYAAGNGCDNPDNDRINPEIALCSTHVYNIGGEQLSNGAIYNPRDDTNRQLMRDVVALKTTVMTQQMYKQYEYLETMIRRFKTQLEKAVLTTKIQVAGGGTSSSAGNSSYSGGINISNNGSSSGNGRNNNTVLAGTTDCSMVAYADAFQCLISNIQLVINAANARTNMSEAKAQLEKDLAVALTWGIVCKNSGKYSSCDTNSSSSSLSSCSTSVSANNIVPCARQFNAVVSRAEWNMNNRQNQGQNRGS